MEIEYKDKGKVLEIELKDTTPSFANALRRIMLSEIPTYAIDEVNIKENSSVLQDEILAHRLGLIPLSGEGKVRLYVEGPLSVKSSHLEILEGEVNIDDKDILIVELLKNQKIDLTCKIKKGIGKEHSKWQSAIVSYQYKKPDRINLTIESCSGLKKEKIIKKSIEILKEKAQKFREEFSKYNI
ncbi:MAG: DNA-directed RNA polymerase subunit D [Candidatus Aenigmarchaeota archaeon ex4484_56]|nr:MAG: DNA-directed RNA polymerase subunit D [Candidatus Aenigmarchaeota archaeon ex4484_56]